MMIFTYLPKLCDHIKKFKIFVVVRMEVIESKEGPHSDQIGTCSEFKPGQKYATPSPGSGDR